jgi:TraC-like protein
MAKKSLTDRRAEKLAQVDAIKKDLAALEVRAGERLGKLALKAGLGDLDLDDNTLIEEFRAIAGRFRSRGNGAEPRPQAEAAPPPPPPTPAA